MSKDVKSICPYVMIQFCIEMASLVNQIVLPTDSHNILVFWD